MRLRTFIVDAFTAGGRPGTGNAAGVVLLPSIVSDPQATLANHPPLTSTSNDANRAENGTLDDAARQRLAAELRQTKTAYVERGREKDHFLLRWFTPTTEVPLCRHATLAAAAALLAEGVKGSEGEGNGHEEGDKSKSNKQKKATASGEDGARETIYCFETVSSGVLKVRARFPPPSPPSSSAPRPTFELDLPSRPPEDPPPRGLRPGGGDGTSGFLSPATKALLRALGRGRCRRCSSRGGDGDDDDEEPSLAPRFREIRFNAELRYLVVKLESSDGSSRGREEATTTRELIESLDPDPRALRDAISMAGEAGGSSDGSGGDGNGSSSSCLSGVIVTCIDNDETAIVSRFFAPWMGIDEDPVTGSAHAVLAPMLDRELWDHQEMRRDSGRGQGGSIRVGGGKPRRFWPARQLIARGGELTVCLLEEEKRVLVAGGAAVALEGLAHV